MFTGFRSSGDNRKKKKKNWKGSRPIGPVPVNLCNLQFITSRNMIIAPLARRAFEKFVNLEPQPRESRAITKRPKGKVLKKKRDVRHKSGKYSLIWEAMCKEKLT